MGPSSSFRIIEILKDMFEGNIGRRYALRVIRDARIPVKDDDILRSKNLSEVVNSQLLRVDESTMKKDEKERVKSYLRRFSKDESGL